MATLNENDGFDIVAQIFFLSKFMIYGTGYSWLFVSVGST